MKLNQIVRARGQPAMSARMIRLGAMNSHAARMRERVNSLGFRATGPKAESRMVT